MTKSYTGGIFCNFDLLIWYQSSLLCINLLLSLTAEKRFQSVPYGECIRIEHGL